MSNFQLQSPVQLMKFSQLAAMMDAKHHASDKIPQGAPEYVSLLGAYVNQDLSETRLEIVSLRKVVVRVLHFGSA